MRKAGIIILVISLGITAIWGVPKIREVSELQTEYYELQDNVDVNGDELENLQTEISQEKDGINSIRNSDVNPYSINEVTGIISSIPNVKIESMDAYNYSDESGNVLIKTFTDTEELSTLDPDINFINYKISAEDVSSVLKTIDGYKLYITSLNVNEKDNLIDLSVRFIGGE